MKRRLDELAARYGLPAEAVDHLAALLAHLAADPHAPTTVRDPARAVDVHVADGLTGLEVEPLRAARTLADLGSGAGFPGLVLAAALPGARVTLVESVARKAAWIRGAAAAASIPAEVVAARAEAWEDGRGTCEAVTARALAALPVLVEYAAPLLVEGGHLVAWKGEVPREEARAGAAAAEALGLEPLPPLAARPFAGARELALHVFRKVAPTPPGYPRRPGMATKRPLGAGSPRRIRPGAG